MELYDLTLLESRRLLDRREISAVELTRSLLDRIQGVDHIYRAYLTVTEQRAIDQAKRADRSIAAGNGTMLTGVPMALKDIISTTAVRTTCGSSILENYVPVFQGQVVDRLVSQGAILLGKTNMDEFAMGSSTEHSAFFPTRNPWDPNTVPGGSSGGSAAAVAGREAVYALGTDTGGSIRQPAALTGTVGVKPSYGRVSRYGLVAFASSLDQIGPLTRTVADAAAVLEVIAGHDPRDSTSLPDPVPDYSAALGGGIRGIRLGVPREYFPGEIQPGVRRRVDEAIHTLEDLGATIEEVSLPTTPYALASYYIIAPSEAMSNLARYDGVRYGRRVQEADVWDMFDATREQGFGVEVKRRIVLGAYSLSKGYYDQYYVKAQKVRTLVKRDFDLAFERVDAIVGPTSPTVAFALGDRMADPVAMYLADVFTLPANMAGICGVSLPCGFVDGLPVGLQVLGKTLDEETVLRVAHTYEQAAGWHTARPPTLEAKV